MISVDLTAPVSGESGQDPHMHTDPDLEKVPETNHWSKGERKK